MNDNPNSNSNHKPLIVAEIGINHNGDLETAKHLVDAAKYAGAHAVKFQTYWNFSPESKQYEFIPFKWNCLFNYCNMANVRWFSTPFTMEAIEFLRNYGQKVWKVPSNRTVLANIPLLKKISTQVGSKIISLGASGLKETEALHRIFGSQAIYCYCISEYPAPLEKLQPFMFNQIKRFGQFGFSDHSLSIAAPCFAVECGAVYIEKHITLDRKQKGPDHKASLEPEEFKLMVDMIGMVKRS